MPFTGRAPSAVCLLAGLALVATFAPSVLAESDTPGQAAAEAPAGSTDARQPAAAAEPAPAFTLDIEKALARLPAKAVDSRDRAGLLAAYAGRRSAPFWMTPRGATEPAIALAAEIRKADDWGLGAAAFDVPELVAAQADGPDLAVDALASSEVRLSLAVLKYARQARAGRLEPTAITKFIDRKPIAPDPRATLEQVAAAASPAAQLRGLNPQHPEFLRLRQHYLTLRDAGEPTRTSAAELRRLLANMEQWRWMPADLGRFHVTVNVPEQLIRVVRDGHVIHTERVVVGKVETQTPIFSDEMEQVIFHPFWGVPDSIKQNEVLPSLRGSGAVLAKYGLRIQSGGRDIDPGAVDWSRADIRKFHVYQPPGASNALGVVKFRFPNKHDVYMHDTPSKSLFKSAVRTFSHGCMRVQNPIRLAELVLAEDKRMTVDKVQALTVKGAPQNNQINLGQHIPVHITYFTVTVDEAGKTSTFKDVYGHEERIALGLEGKFSQIKPVPEPKGPASAEPVARLVDINSSSGFGFGGGGGSGGSRDRGWTQNVFGGN